MVGIQNVTVVHLDNITAFGNMTTLPEFFLRVNHVIYGGWLFFILLWVAFLIMFMAAQKFRDQPLNNLLYASGLCSIVGFLLRGVTGQLFGGTVSLVTDHQLWIFPLLTIVFAVIIWSIKD